MRLPALFAALSLSVSLPVLAAPPDASAPAPKKAPGLITEASEAKPATCTEEEWKKKMTPLQYEVMRKKGTEPSKSGKWYKHKAHGTYNCSACGQALFRSDTKFDSGTGWPSFYDVAVPGAVETQRDGFNLEVVCSKCKGHLGHVFNDGPAPTGKRYCINSIALDFTKEPKKK